MGRGMIFVVVLLVVVGCKKPQQTTSIGGKGGTNTIAVTPEHHGEFVDTCTVYIKYNTLDAPADGIYDDSAACVQVDTIPVATFTGLKQGNYYLFGKGIHATYTPPNVKGGLPCTISNVATVKVYLPTYSY
ncbi:MAG: hypothetical protein JWQ38_3172 [Flavipsychrobacter sp.]|nr:hypothetical protein [Flavipsychrobacter sp.]